MDPGGSGSSAPNPGHSGQGAGVRHRNRNRNRNRCRTRKQQQPPDLSIPPDCTIVDSHCHLHYLYDSFPHYNPKELREALTVEKPNAFTGIEAVVTSYCDPAAFSPSLGTWQQDLASDWVYGCFGVHPHHAKDYTPALEERVVSALAEAPPGKAVAWGECGLDFGAMRSPRDVQIRVFERQVDLACRMGYPIVLHIAGPRGRGGGNGASSGTGDVEEKTLRVLREHASADTRIHFHCFRGTQEFADVVCSEFKSFLGFTSILMDNRGRDLQDIVMNTDLDRLLVETDSPYMAPNWRSRHSLPGDCAYIAQKIAELKGLPYADVLRQIRKNTHVMYGI